MSLYGHVHNYSSQKSNQKVAVTNLSGKGFIALLMITLVKQKLHDLVIKLAWLQKNIFRYMQSHYTLVLLLITPETHVQKYFK